MTNKPAEDWILLEVERVPDELEALLHKVVKEVIPEDWYKEIPNVVDHRMTTIPITPGQLNVSTIFLDVALADPYGKFSPKSRLCTNGFPVLAVHLWGDYDKLKQWVVVKFRECLEELKEFVRDGADVPLGQNWKDWKAKHGKA